MTKVERALPSVQTQISAGDAGMGYAVHTSGTSSFEVESELWPESSNATAATDSTAGPPADAVVRRYAVRGALSASNTNLLGTLGGSESTTRGRLHYTIASTSDTLTRASTFDYPYLVADSQSNGEDSFRMSGLVNLTAHRREEWSAGEGAGEGAAAPPPLVLAWTSGISSKAVYNRSTGPNRTIYEEVSDGAAHFRAHGGACFNQRLVTHEGGLLSAHFDDGCPASAVRTALCARFDACDVQVLLEPHRIRRGGGRARG